MYRDHLEFEGRSFLRFTVLGEPIAAPRMTQADKWQRRPCVVRYRFWKDAIRRAAGIVPPADHVLSLSWAAFFEPPPSWSAKRRAAAMGQRHRSKPDRDNLDKAILDALFDDDQAVSIGAVGKFWGSPARLEVEIRVQTSQDVVGAVSNLAEALAALGGV